MGNLETKINDLDNKITSNVINEMRKMFEQITGKPARVDDAPSSLDSPNKDGDVLTLEVDPEKAKAQANADSGKGENGTSSTSKAIPGVYSQVPPEQVYNQIHRQVDKPHIANMGAPPKLDTKEFPNWQFCMKSHMSSSCVDLLDIIERGFSPRDPANLTPSEKADHQLNATAMHMIQTAAGPTYLTHL